MIDITTTLQILQAKSKVIKWNDIFQLHGSQTSIVSLLACPGLSIYKNSCSTLLHDVNSSEKDNAQEFPSDKSKSLFLPGKKFLLLALGLHPQQSTVEEQLYASTFKSIFDLLLFCDPL